MPTRCRRSTYSSVDSAADAVAAARGVAALGSCSFALGGFALFALGRLLFDDDLRRLADDDGGLGIDVGGGTPWAA